MTGPQLEWVVASTRHGTLLQDVELGEVSAPLEELAATLPEIFGTAETGCLERIASRLGADAGGGTFVEVLLLSESRLHVIHRLVGRPGRALLASAPAGRSVGLILSQVHARAAELAGDPA